jgi:hypothetical protein
MLNGSSGWPVQKAVDQGDQRRGPGLESVIHVVVAFYRTRTGQDHEGSCTAIHLQCRKVSLSTHPVANGESRDVNNNLGVG